MTDILSACDAIRIYVIHQLYDQIGVELDCPLRAAIIAGREAHCYEQKL